LLGLGHPYHRGLGETGELRSKSSTSATPSPLCCFAPGGRGVVWAGSGSVGSVYADSHLRPTNILNTDLRKKKKWKIVEIVNEY
jgi:hypothetical protein